MMGWGGPASVLEQLARDEREQMALRTAHRPDRHGIAGDPAEDVIEFSDRIPEILRRTGKHDDYLDVPLLTHVKKGSLRGRSGQSPFFG
jgi:hypothetical protein